VNGRCHVYSMCLTVNKYNSLHAGCYIKLLREIMIKRAIVNVQSMDNVCFAWSVVAALYRLKKNLNEKPRILTTQQR